MAKAKGSPKTGGRHKGVPNKATRDIKVLAQTYSEQAVEELAKLAGVVADHPGAESEQARISALKELLDRAHGKASQSVDLDLSVKRDAANLTDAELAAIATRGSPGATSAPNGKAQSH